MWAIYTRGWEKLAILDGNLHLSLKRCEVGQVTIQNIFFTLLVRQTDYNYAYTFLKLCSFAIAFAAYIYFLRVNKINFHFFRLHGYVICFVMYRYIVKLGTSW